MNISDLIKKGISVYRQWRDIPNYTVQRNLEIWENHDWSRFGHEWTEDSMRYRGLDSTLWKKQIIESLIKKYMMQGGVILEIGPGGGRWTEILVKQARRLILVDITKKCLELCKERFRGYTCVEYQEVKSYKNFLNFLPDCSVHSVWAYDVFVHFNPSDVKKYIKEISRVLVKNGVAVIHHAGTYASHADRQEGWRGHMSPKLFKKYVTSNKMKMIEQNLTLSHKLGDVVSVFQRI